MVAAEGISFSEGLLFDQLTSYSQKSQTSTKSIEFIKYILDICEVNFIDINDIENIYIADNGNNFSGGQKQRMLIARALISKRPILIMDESTSALDKATQIKVLNNLREIDHIDLLIHVSHDKSVIDNCDKKISLN